MANPLLFRRPPRTAIRAALPRGIAPHGDPGERRETRRKAAPHPRAQVLEARLFQPFALVEQAMVERGAQLRAGLLELAEIDRETGARIRLAAQRDLGLEGVPVHALIRMPGGKMR